MPPTIPDKIPCESLQQLEQEISTLRHALSFGESEETWDRIANALSRFSAVVKGGGYKFEKELVDSIKASSRPIVSAMNSERTRLSAAALDCLTVIAPRTGLSFEPLVSLFMPHILRLATRSNKVYVTRSQASLALILSYCHIPSIVPHLLAACKESKIVTGRAVAIEGALRCLNKWDWAQKEIKVKVGDVEEIIRITGRDKDAGIRQTSRKVFEAYKALFPERVEEFTGPLTPVMKKYLDIKPQPLAQKAVERARPPSTQEKCKRPLPKRDFALSTSALPETIHTEGAHVRSASSNAVIEGRSASTGSSHSQPSGLAAVARSMPPPASIPSRTRNVSRPRAQPPSDPNHHQSEHDNHERHRVLSTASSTFSVKSTPSVSHPEYVHRPPVRLATSHSHSVVVNTATAGSSGQARRVPRVVAVEPHPANHPDSFATVHKAPVPVPGATAPRVLRPNHEPKQENVGVTQFATGVMFPSSETENATTMERKGAQRVPVSIPASAIPDAERPTSVMSNDAKRHVKPSVFRRGAPGAPLPGEKGSKEGFAPRRGGGVTQPTLSQLSKQKAPVSANISILSAGAKVTNASAASNRPVWGAGMKSTLSKGSLASRGRVRGGIVTAPTAKQGDKASVGPTITSTTLREVIAPQLVPLPESPRIPQTNGDHRDKEILVHDEMSLQDEATAHETPSHEDETPSQEETYTPEEAPSPEETASEAHDIVEGSTEPNTSVGRTRETQEINEETRDNIATVPSPQTPPFPSTDGESDEDELDAIEFTTGEAYDPTGVPIKTPCKAKGITNDGILRERNPLGDVVLNG